MVDMILSWRSTVLLAWVSMDPKVNGIWLGINRGRAI